MSVPETKKEIARLLTCHPDDLATPYLKTVMRQLGYALDFRFRSSWSTALDVLNNYFTEYDRVFMGAGVSYFRRNPFYNLSHVPQAGEGYYHRENDWNLTHKLQYCDPSTGVVERETWVIFCPDEGVYKVRRIRLRFTYLDGTHEQKEYDYSLQQPQIPCFLL
ncbi:MAG: hypothetical protein ACFBSC_22610 [Microcoleaceae cyanobacterium]